MKLDPKQQKPPIKDKIKEPVRLPIKVPIKPTINNDFYKDKLRGSSVDAPIIRRDTYNSLHRIGGVSNSYSNTKYGAINPINGMTNQNFNPKSYRKDNPIAMMTTTGMISNNPTKLNKYDRMGASGLNFNNERQLRQTSSNAYIGGLGGPALKKNYTSDNFNSGVKQYPVVRGSSQQLASGRAQGRN